MSDIRPTVNARDLTAVLEALPADMSVLLVGPHGIGKSQIVYQLGHRLGLPVVDRRLAQMTEGDMIGLPDIKDGMTKFLPVDWFARGCHEPVVLFLDEINRATPEIQAGAFQIVLDREMNGMKLHPGTRVISAVNGGGEYTTNEMDPALINRFALFNFEPDAADWLEWAVQHGIDSVLVDFIRHNHELLRFKELNKMEPLTAYPTPRGWAAVDRCLKAAKIPPFEVCGSSPPGHFYTLCMGLVGAPAAVAFTKFVKEYQRIITAEDIFDNWDEKQNIIKALPHDAIIPLLDKIQEHGTKHKWSREQAQNLAAFAMSCLTGEDHVILFVKVAATKDIDNVKSWHATACTMKLVEEVLAGKALQDQKDG